MLEWWYLEREKQSANRLEMAIDADFTTTTSGITRIWRRSLTEAKCLCLQRDRATVDWLIGTERRTRADWKVLPRTEDDVPGADDKTKFPEVHFGRQPSSVRAVSGICGCNQDRGWLVDDGVQDDLTVEVLYSKYEDWRTSRGTRPATSWTCPMRATYSAGGGWMRTSRSKCSQDGESVIRAAVDDVGAYDGEQDDEDMWYPEIRFAKSKRRPATSGVSVTLGGSAPACQTDRVPVPQADRRCMSSPKARGAGRSFQIRRQEHISAVPRLMMRVHFAVLTEAAMLAWSPSKLRAQRIHANADLVLPTRTRLSVLRGDPPGDIQADINKRIESALAEQPTRSWPTRVRSPIGTRREKRQVGPTAVIIKRAGKDFEMVRDYQARLFRSK